MGKGRGSDLRGGRRKSDRKGQAVHEDTVMKHTVSYAHSHKGVGKVARNGGL